MSLPKPLIYGCFGMDKGVLCGEMVMSEAVILNRETERLDEINENLKLIQKKNGLTFGTDAYLLAAFTKACPRGVAVDLGCGTGVISLLCATRDRFRNVVGVELQESFAELTSRNISLNGLTERMSVVNCDVRTLTQKEVGGQVDAVFTNPPYMKAASGRENPVDEKNIARRELNGTIYDFCHCAGRLLKSGGAFYAVHRPERLCDLMCSMRDAKIEPKTLLYVCPDTKSQPSLILIEGRKDGSPSMTLSRPLYIYKEGTREYTDDMNAVYDNFTLEHVLGR